MKTWNVWLVPGTSEDRAEVTADTFAIGDSGVLLFLIKGEVIAAFGKNSWAMLRTK